MGVGSGLKPYSGIQSHLGGNTLQVLSPKTSRCIFLLLPCFLVLNYFNNTRSVLSARNTICLSTKCQETFLYPSVVWWELRFSKPSGFLEGQYISEPFIMALTISLPGMSVLLVITIYIFWNFTFDIFHCYKHLQYVLVCSRQSNALFTWMAARRLSQSTVTAKEGRLSRWYYYPEVCLLPPIIPPQCSNSDTSLPASLEMFSPEHPKYTFSVLQYNYFLLYNYILLLFLPSFHLLSWCQQLPEFTTFTS